MIAYSRYQTLCSDHNKSWQHYLAITIGLPSLFIVANDWKTRGEYNWGRHSKFSIISCSQTMYYNVRKHIFQKEASYMSWALRYGTKHHTIAQKLPHLFIHIINDWYLFCSKYSREVALFCVKLFTPRAQFALISNHQNMKPWFTK